MLSQLNDYDWGHVFAYAGEKGEEHCDGSANVEVALPSRGALQPFEFTREDVADIYGIEVGQRDGPSWICYGRLKNNYYFYIDAGCDYTGWG